MSTSRVAVTLGDPAGVGPEVIVKALASLPQAERDSFIIVGNVEALERANRLTGMDLAFSTTPSVGSIAVDEVAIDGSLPDIGKVSPVHFFWGSFDLAVTRFSGRTAPPHPGGIPNLPDEVTREAYSHEVSSAGFWPGGGFTDYAAYYSYAYPAPAGFADAQVRPDEAHFEKSLGEFVLPYDAVRRSSEPEAALMAFLQSTYSAAAELGGWDRAALECETGEPRRPRPV